MTTLKQIENDVMAYCRRVVPVRELHIENQDISAPSEPYVAVSLDVVGTSEHDVSTYNEDHTEQEVRGLSLVRVRLSVWGGNASQDANRLQKGLQTDDAIFDVFNHMGKGDVKSVNNLTLKVNGKLKPRYEFEFMGHAALSETYQTSYFDKVELDGVTIGTNHSPKGRD